MRILTCFTFCVMAALAQSTLTPAEINDVLAAHNKYRREVGVAALTWSPKLAATAAAHAGSIARQGALRHSNTGNGENLAFNSRGSLVEMIEQWGREKVNFISRNGKTTGHYTQIVWKGTQQVGCGLARNAQGNYLVCQYTPAGNIDGEKPY